MYEVGDIVQVRYPQYAAGFYGKIIAQEESGRWLVELEGNPLEDPCPPIVVSLESEEIQLMQKQSVKQQLS